MLRRLDGVLVQLHDVVAHQLLIEPSVVHERAEHVEVHGVLLIFDEGAARRRRPLNEQDGDTFDGRQKEDRLDVRRVEVFFDVLLEPLILPLSPTVKIEGRMAPGDLVVEPGRILCRLERLDEGDWVPGAAMFSMERALRR